MPSNRKIVFANGEYYHVFNRGVERRPTFTNRYEFARALDTTAFYRYGNLPIKYSKYLNLNKDKKAEFLQALDQSNLQVDIIAFCFMGNHFHFLLKQLEENGIVKFMAKFTNSYTKYFNTKYNRIGPLFQGVFKAVHIETDDQLLHLSRYIHLNPVTSFMIKAVELKNYEWTSYPEYFGLTDRKLINIKEILGFFKKPSKYESFVLDHADYAMKLKSIEHLTID